MFSNNEQTDIPPNSSNDTMPKSISNTLSLASSLDTSLQPTDDTIPPYWWYYTTIGDTSYDNSFQNGYH